MDLADRLVATAKIMEGELDYEDALLVIGAIEAEGMEVAPHGSMEIVEKLTRVCPDCEGSLGGGGGNSGEPEWHCTTCVGGRVVLTPQQRELLVLLLDDAPDGVPLFDAEQTAALVEAREVLATVPPTG